MNNGCVHNRAGSDADALVFQIAVDVASIASASSCRSSKWRNCKMVLSSGAGLYDALTIKVPTADDTRGSRRSNKVTCQDCGQIDCSALLFVISANVREGRNYLSGIAEGCRSRARFLALACVFVNKMEGRDCFS